MQSISYVTCVDIIALVSLTPLSIFLFLDVPTLKLSIIIIELTHSNTILENTVAVPSKIVF